MRPPMFYQVFKKPAFFIRPNRASPPADYGHQAGSIPLLDELAITRNWPPTRSAT